MLALFLFKLTSSLLFHIVFSNMDWENIAKELTIETSSKIILLVLDGLGDLPLEGKTPLETAHTPHLDRLAKQSVCGLTDPVSCARPAAVLRRILVPCLSFRPPMVSVFPDFQISVLCAESIQCLDICTLLWYLDT